MMSHSFCLLGFKQEDFIRNILIHLSSAFFVVKVAYKNHRIILFKRP